MIRGSENHVGTFHDIVLTRNQLGAFLLLALRVAVRFKEKGLRHCSILPEKAVQEKQR
jgi:hypothetical protein